MRPILYIIPTLILTGLRVSTLAQEASIPDPGLNAAIREALQKPREPLTEQDLLSLTVLEARGRNVRSVEGLEAAGNLVSLDLQSNLLTSFSLPNGLTNLETLDLSLNSLTNCSLASGFTNLAKLLLEANLLTSLTLPADLTGLNNLDLSENEITSFNLPSNLTSLRLLDLGSNSLTSFSLPGGLTNLTSLKLDGNLLTNFTLPGGLTGMGELSLADNRLTGINLPAGLTNLTSLSFVGNQLTNVTLPPDMTQLVALGFLANPLTTFVLPETLAATNLAGDVAFLQSHGVEVFTYPLAIQLIRLQQPIGAFQFTITGPPGIYTVFSSTDLTAWSVLRTTINQLGKVVFTDGTAHLSPRTFYRALLQTPPANMVFIEPNTFTMGTPTNELARHVDEGPQTTVTISRGFWIGKYEVTQREYLAVIGSNPSGFPGDLDRPVESVSWLDATNYCARLTQQELAAGRIPPGSHYRLPTEAEWECAARAGTSTRFSYGDDPNFASLTHHAWYWFNRGFGTHPVGQKAPNPWGLYDTEGNVLEWTQDWYGPYPGGFVTDPQGPVSNVQGVKVIRGGAWDASEPDCRSGRRLTEGVHPFIHDFILGFRVVLVTEP